MKCQTKEIGDFRGFEKVSFFKQSKIFDHVRKNKSFFQTKAQSGVNAAILVAIILGLIVLYVVYLPTSEREKLLLNKTTDEGVEEEEDGNILLLEYPKRLDKVKDIDEKLLPNVYLFKSTQAEEIERINPLSVRNGVFDKEDKTVSFSIDNVENIDNVLLSFTAKKHKGVLIIKLNDKIIYENEIISEIVEPVRLKKTILERDNTLEFSVSSVGFKFWTTNEYSLDDIKIIGDITDITRQKSQNVFALTQTEYNNLEKVTLRFIPYCSGVSDVGMLDILVNNHNIFSAVPVCDDPYKQIIPLGTLNAGENFIVFQTSEGSYSIEQIELESEVKETKKTIYYFEINESTWDRIADEDLDVRLKIEFVDDEENKRADLNINGHLTSIDQEEKDYSRSIRNWVDEGNNYIEIKPKTTLEVKELRVEIEEKD